MDSVIIQVITALATTVVTLAGLLKFYLPRHDQRIHNPHLEELKAIHSGIDKNSEKIGEVVASLSNQKDVANERHNQLISSLRRIEERVTTQER